MLAGLYITLDNQDIVLVNLKESSAGVFRDGKPKHSDQPAGSPEQRISDMDKDPEEGQSMALTLMSHETYGFPPPLSIRIH